MTTESAKKCEGETQLQVIEDALSNAPCFNELPPPVIQELAERVCHRFIRAGETVFTQSQYDGHEVYCMVQGTATLTKTGTGTDALRVEDLSAGDIFGLEHALSDGPEISCRVGLIAKTDASVIIIDRSTLRDIVKRRPLAARAFLKFVARQALLHETRQIPVQEDPYRKIFRALFDVVKRDGIQVPGAWRVPVMPKHRELGEIAGTSELDAAEAVAILIRRGIVKRDYPGLVIADVSKFKSLIF